jgi:hypothetical protein
MERPNSSQQDRAGTGVEVTEVESGKGRVWPGKFRRQNRFARAVLVTSFS